MVDVQPESTHGLVAGQLPFCCAASGAVLVSMWLIILPVVMKCLRMIVWWAIIFFTFFLFVCNYTATAHK
jgi:hypothetical protein